ncbi:MAG: aminoacetone oxidase family FAD-binding enzyme, partial [Sphingobacteriia bacterium]|nr:aminoacetone oxidase family FAD-binding enzyme [Sphingobacteriia bacterium]
MGSAGLFLALALRDCGRTVHVYDQQNAAARKFLVAGEGGLNLTHSEPAV